MLDVRRRHPDGVRGNRLRPPEADRLEKAGRRQLVLLGARSCTSSFVSARWMITGTCSRSASARHAFSVARSRVYIACGATAGVIRSSPANSFDETLRRGPGPPAGVFASGDRELDDRLAEDAAQARRARRPRDLLLEVVHVGVGRRPRLDHLERRQPRAGAHELRRDGLRFGREDVLLRASPSAPGRRPGRGYSTIGAWVWVLIRPGMTTCPPASMVSRAREAAARSSRPCRPRRCRGRRWPRPRGQRRGDAPSMVTTMPLVTTSETARRGRRLADERRGDDDRSKAKVRQRRIGPPILSAGCRILPVRTLPGSAAPAYSEPVPVHVVEHPLVHDALATLRDAATPPELFRRMAVRISLLLAAEATRDLPASRGDGRRRRSDRPRRGASATTWSSCRCCAPASGMLDAVLELIPERARRAHRPAARRERRRSPRSTTRSCPAT